jgi:phosphatidylserine/phosphatidylglycerophosphate/cardiolipin synthase-like enzyme
MPRNRHVWRISAAVSGHDDGMLRRLRSASSVLHARAAALLGALLLPACSGATKTSSAEDAATHDAGQPPPSDAGTGSDAPAHSDASDGGDAGTGLTLVTEPADGLTAIYDLVKSAKTSIDMTMYELEDTTLEGLLTAAAKNGVTVRVILDQNLEKSSNTGAYDTLSAGGVQMHWANPSYAATHQKTLTVDGTTSAIMTLNTTTHYYPTSRDFAVITSDAADVQAIEKVFGADFTNTPILPPTADDLVWSPTSAEPALLGLINGAKASLLIENEEMSDYDVVSALSTAAKNGVAVQVVMTASRSWDTNFTTLTAAGVKVVTYASSASLYIHAKVILADVGTSNASVFIGSENFSNASLTENRELGLIVKDPAVLSSIDATLTSDFKGGTPY